MANEIFLEQFTKRISLHNHTCAHSDCASIEPLELIFYSSRAGFDGVAITEHGYQWDEEEILRLKKEAVEKKYCQHDFILFSGQEVEVEDGVKTPHALVFGFPRTIDEKVGMLGLCELVHGVQGAVVVLAHPRRFGYKYEIENPLGYPADGIEILQKEQNNAEVLNDIKSEPAKFALIGSDDVHHSSCIWQNCTLFQKKVQTGKDVIRAVKDKLTIPAYDSGKGLRMYLNHFLE